MGNERASVIAREKFRSLVRYVRCDSTNNARCKDKCEFRGWRMRDEISNKIKDERKSFSLASLHRCSLSSLLKSNNVVLLLPRFRKECKMKVHDAFHNLWLGWRGRRLIRERLRCLSLVEKEGILNEIGFLGFLVSEESWDSNDGVNYWSLISSASVQRTTFKPYRKLECRATAIRF